MQRNPDRPVVTIRYILSAVYLACLFSSGCTQLVGDWTNKDWTTPNLMPGSKDPEPKVPGRILAIWTDAVHHKQGEPAQRGFGGRVVFYDDNEKDPIEVEGTLTVYAFADEDGSQSKQPERKFIFEAEQLKKHYSRCSLGHSYSVWLPWDTVGGPNRQISLITRFEGSQGGTVISEPARKLLPGVEMQKLTANSEEALAQPDSPGNVHPIRLASFVSEENGRPLTPRRLADSTAQPLGAVPNSPATSVQTVDLTQPNRSAQATQTIAVPSALGMKPLTYPSTGTTGGEARQFSKETIPNAPGFQSRMEREGQESTSQLNQLLPRKPEVVGDVRIEQQDGATVYYGRPNSPNSAWQDTIRSPRTDAGNMLPGQNLGPATSNPSTGAAIHSESVHRAGIAQREYAPQFQNYAADSIRLREEQLKQVTDSRRQFRSEPWRFPVRTQAIARQADAASGLQPPPE